jgi:glycosyltransferase involved in cell wall biosynthesis
MSPVESMSAGKPVLWVNDGGLKETIIHEKTGYLIDPQCNISDIVSAVKYLSPEKSLSMQESCQLRAQEFWLEAFERKLKEYM